jgi:hypothetical protein
MNIILRQHQVTAVRSSLQMIRVLLPVRALIVALALMLPSVAALAHHSFSMFDSTKVITLSGTIKELQWAAPHVLIWFVEDPKDGAAAGDTGGRVWTIELSTSPGPLTRLGWNKRTLVPGDRVTVDISPLHSGEPGGSFRKLTILGTGQVLTSAAVGSDPAAASQLPAASAAGGR